MLLLDLRLDLLFRGVWPSSLEQESLAPPGGVPSLTPLLHRDAVFRVQSSGPAPTNGASLKVGLWPEWSPNERPMTRVL